MNTEAAKTFTTAYNAKRAAGKFLITNRMDPATEVTVIKLFDKAYTYSLPLDAAPIPANEELEQAQFAAVRGAEVRLSEPESPAMAALKRQAAMESELEDAKLVPVLLNAAIATLVDPAEDEPLRVENADEAAAVAALEAAAQAKAAKRKPRLSFEEKMAARAAAASAPPPAKKAKAAQPRKQREPKAADAPSTPRVKRADGLTEGSAMAKLVDYAAEAPRTNAELCAHVGWAQCLPMLRKGAEKTGRRFSTTKVQGEPTRYQLVAADAA